jgi:hypothetical protein
MRTTARDASRAFCRGRTPETRLYAEALRAELLLQISGLAELFDQTELRFEPVDVLLLGFEDVFE